MIRTRFRFMRTAAVLGVAVFGFTPIVTSPAVAAPAAANCTITGYTAPNAAQAGALRTKLAGQSVNDLAGVQLRNGGIWKIPSGSVPVVVVDSAQPLKSGRATMSAFGLTFNIASGTGGSKPRYVSADVPPLLGSITRTAKVEGAADDCTASVTVLVDRSPYSTVAGAAGIALAVVAGVLAIVFARRRRAGRITRILLAGAFGLLAGLGESLVLHEASLIKPDSPAIALGPAIGLVLGILLARPWRGGRPAGDTAPVPFVAPTHAEFGRYRPLAELDRTIGTIRYIAMEPGSETRVLLTTVRPDAEDPVAARGLFDRHVAVLRRVNADHLPRVRELLEASAVAAGTMPDDDSTALAATLVTEPDVVGTVRQFLDGQRRFTGEQSANVLHDVLAGLSAVHGAGLVHRDVTPSSIHLHPVDGAMLGTFELARPGDADVDAIEGSPVYLSPEQRRHEPLDARSDLFACGVLLAELLVGETPLPDASPEVAAAWDGKLSTVAPPLAALIQRALSPDPDDRPQSADTFLTDLDEAASAAYGADWMSIGALTGAVLVPGGAIVAGGALITAGAGAVAAGGTSALQAGPVAGAAGALTGSASNPALTGATVAVSTVKTGASKVAMGVPAVAGGAVAVVIAVVAAVVGPTPAAVADETLDASTARIITVNTWGEARGGGTAHVDESQAGGVTSLFKLPGVNVADLTDIKIGIPRGQKGYPAYFVATAAARLSDGRTVYLVVRFSRASVDQPWKLTELRYDTDKLNIPVPAIDPDGYLKPTPPPGELVLDPATIAKLYADWGSRVAASSSLGTDPVLAIGAGESFLRITAANANVHAGQFFNTFVFTPGSAEPGIMLADGTLLVRFTGKATEDLFNRPAPAAGSCDTGAGRVYVGFGAAGMPTGEFRKVHVDWSITADARIPVKGAQPLGGPETAGKALVQDSSYAASNPQSVPC